MVARYSESCPFNGKCDHKAALEIHLSSWQLPRVLPRQTVFLKYCQGDYFLAKYIFSLQFLILISWQNYCLQIRDITCKCLYVVQEVRSIIYFRQFIHPLSFGSCGNSTTFAFMSYIIVLAKFYKVTLLNNFYFVSFFYPLFICRRQRKIRLVILSKSYSYKFFF